MRTKLAFVIALLFILPIITLGQGIKHLHDEYYRYKGLVISIDMDNTVPWNLGNFLVLADTTLDYYSAINHGVFIADTYKGGDLSSYDFHRITFDEETEAKTIMARELRGVVSDISAETSYCVSGFWSNRLWKDCVYFRVFEIDFIFRKYKQVSFETANAHAQDEDEALIEYTTTVYFITEVLTLKRVKVGTSKIPEPRKGSAFRPYKDGNRYGEARSGCRPVRIMEDSVHKE